MREEKRTFSNDRFTGPPPTQNSRFSKAVEADGDYVRPEDRNMGPKHNRVDDDDVPRGPPPVVQNSRFAAAAAEMEAEKEIEMKDREERRAMRGPPRDMEGPPPIQTNSRFASAAADREIEKEREMREREERRNERQPPYEERGGNGGSRYGDDRGGNGGGRYGDDRGGNGGERFGDDRGGNGGGRYGDDRGGNGGGRYGDDRGGMGGGRYGGRMGRGNGEVNFPAMGKDRTTTTFVKPELPSHLQPKKAEEPILPTVKVPLALPGEDEEAAMARIEKKRKEEADKILADKKAAEEAAVRKRAEEAAAAAEAKKAADSESEMFDVFINGGKSGIALKEWCESQGGILPSVEKLVFHLLKTTQKDDPSPECTWAEQSNYGAALASLVGDNSDAMIEVLFAIQRFCSDIGFPKINNEGLVQSMFRNMYKFDLADEDAFAEWKDDESVKREEGKGKAIIQTMDWFNWLEEDEQSEEESDEAYE